MRRLGAGSLVLFLAAICFDERGEAAAVPSGFTDTPIVSGLSGPTAMALAPDGRIFITQQGGRLRVVKNGVLLSQSFVILSVDASGERGLLGVALDPNFSTNNYLYLYYTMTTTPRHNRVSRFTANGDVALANSELPILDLENLSATNHNGGAIHFGPDGKLYVAVGDNAVGSNSQTLTNRLGKMLRINSDGSIPADNPFVGVAGANAAIWALGLRNPFTFAFQPGTGRMFINDVGQNQWEEINDGIAGSNYGWPDVEGPSPVLPGYRSPLYSYPHGGGPLEGFAITGGVFYNPDQPQFPPQYTGKYFFADWVNDWINVFDPAAGTAAPFATGILGAVDLQLGPDGSLYYLSQGSGMLGRISYRLPDRPTGLRLTPRPPA